MTLKSRTWKHLLFALVAVTAAFLSTTSAFADKLFLKDGRILEGKVKKQDAIAVVFVEIKDGKEGEPQYFSPDEVSRVQIEESKPAAPAAAAPAAPAPAAAKPDAAKPDTAAKPTGSSKPEKVQKQITGRPVRIAILNFGPPSAWQGSTDGMVGREINAPAWRHVIPMLEKDDVDVVVVRINSGGGYVVEEDKFHELYELYKTKFRLVAWVESAISAAAMSPWNIEEFYMLPEGNIGACTSWFGNLQAVDPVSREKSLAMMEKVSALGKRSPTIMRSMQIPEPLSCNIDAEGNVTWFQDLSGQYTVNRPGQILTLTAPDAVKYKFAKAIAATKDELARALGYSEFTWAGKEAADYIDQNMKDCDRTNKRIAELDRKYGQAVAAARQLRNDKQLRMQEIGKARQALQEMKKWMAANPNFAWIFNRPAAWFDEQEEMLKRLARD